MENSVSRPAVRIRMSVWVLPQHSAVPQHTAASSQIKCKTDVLYCVIDNEKVLFKTKNTHHSHHVWLHVPVCWWLLLDTEIELDYFVSSQTQFTVRSTFCLYLLFMASCCIQCPTGPAKMCSSFFCLSCSIMYLSFLLKEKLCCFHGFRTKEVDLCTLILSSNPFSLNIFIQGCVWTVIHYIHWVLFT